MILKRDKSKLPRLLTHLMLLFKNFPPSNLKLMLKPFLLNSTESVVITPSLPLFHLLQLSHQKNLKLLMERSLNLELHLFNQLKMIKKLKLKLKLTSEIFLKNLLLKEKLLLEPLATLPLSLPKLNNSLLAKRRERKMLQENLLLPPLVRPKKKLTALLGEPNTKMIPLTEPKKLELLDKLKKSLLLSLKVHQVILKIELVHEEIEFFNI